MRMNTEGLLEKIRSVKDETADGKNRLPDRKVIVYILKETQVILMPEYFHFSELSQEEALVELSASLCKLIRRIDDSRINDSLRLRCGIVFGNFFLYHPGVYPGKSHHSVPMRKGFLHP